MDFVLSTICLGKPCACTFFGVAPRGNFEQPPSPPERASVKLPIPYLIMPQLELAADHSDFAKDDLK